MHIPDLTKARVTEKKGKVITRKEIAAFFKQYPEHKGQPTSVIIDVIRVFNQLIAKETTRNVYGVNLPENIGRIVINNAGKPKHKAVDFHESKKQGKIVYHRNWDTDNNTMRITYFNNIRNYVRHSNLFGFNPLQAFKKDASVYFKKNWARCIVLNYKHQVE